MVIKTAIFGAGHNAATVVWNKKRGFYPEIEIVGFIDDYKKGDWCKLPIVGTSTDFESLKDEGIEGIIVTAVAKPRERLNLCQRISDMGFLSPKIIPELPEWVQVGKGVYLDPTAVLNGVDIILEDYVIVGPLAFVEGGVKLRKGAIAMAQSFIGYESIIGEASCVCPKAIVKPKCVIGKDCYINPAKVLQMGMELKDGSTYPALERM